MFKEFIYVFIGGGAGSVARYLIGRALSSLGVASSLWATFAANIAGCVLIGVLGAFLLRGCLSENLRLLLIVGLCGGMTTFSTFSNESVALLRSGDYVAFAGYLLASVAVGIIAVIVGHKIAC